MKLADLRKIYKEAGIGAKAIYGVSNSILIKDGKLSGKYLGEICHSFMNRVKAHDYSIQILNFERSKDVVTDKEREIWYNYLINHSPWKSIYLNRSAKEVVKSRLLFMVSDVPKDHWMQAAVATRYVWEYERFVRVFAAASKYECNPNALFIMCHFVSGEKDLCFNANFYGHIAIDVNRIGGKPFQQFLNGKLYKSDKDLMSKAGPYGEFSTKFLSEHKDKLQEEYFKSIFEEARKSFDKVGVVKENKNPFLKAKAVRNNDNRERFGLEDMAKFMAKASLLLVEKQNELKQAA